MGRARRSIAKGNYDARENKSKDDVNIFQRKPYHPLLLRRLSSVSSLVLSAHSHADFSLTPTILRLDKLIFREH